jgi:hypothetical protein
MNDRDTEEATAEKMAVMASSPEDYKRLGLSPTSIEPWEDGARTDGSAGTYEWCRASLAAISRVGFRQRSTAARGNTRAGGRPVSGCTSPVPIEDQKPIEAPPVLSGSDAAGCESRSPRLPDRA